MKVVAKAHRDFVMEGPIDCSTVNIELSQDEADRLARDGELHFSSYDTFVHIRVEGRCNHTQHYINGQLWPAETTKCPGPAEVPEWMN